MRKQNMIKSKTDLSILLIFFARPNTLSSVFAAVKKARPSKLFLACDGAREGNQRDVESIEKCKILDLESLIMHFLR